MNITTIATTAIICCAIVAVFVITMKTRYGKCFMHGHDYSEHEQYTANIYTGDSLRPQNIVVTDVFRCVRCRTVKKQRETYES